MPSGQGLGDAIDEGVIIKNGVDAPQGGSQSLSPSGRGTSTRLRCL